VQTQTLCESPGTNTGSQVSLAARCGKAKNRAAITVSLVLLRFGLGGFLAWSGLGKLHASYDFLSAIYSYELVGPKLGLAAALLVPPLELAAGSCLLAGIFVEGAFLLSVLLSCGFVVFQGWGLKQGLLIDCACFGASQDTRYVSDGTFLFAVAFLVVSAGGLAIAAYCRMTETRHQGPLV
jgi:putative oxidoreductase